MVLRPCAKVTAASAVKALARRFRSDEVVGIADSLRWVRGLEGPDFGWASNRTSAISVV
jgi:hypothetical protein